MKTPFLLTLLAVCLLSTISFGQTTIPGAPVNGSKPNNSGSGPDMDIMNYTHFEYFVLTATTNSGDIAKLKFNQPSDPASLKKAIVGNPEMGQQLANFYSMMQNGGSMTDVFNSLGAMGFELVTVSSFFDDNKALNYVYYFKKKIEPKKQGDQDKK